MLSRLSLALLTALLIQTGISPGNSVRAAEPTPSRGTAALSGSAQRDDGSLATSTHVPVEIELTAVQAVANSDRLEVDGVFTAPDGRTLRVPAFWAGGNVWKLRYASAQTGRHRYRTEVAGGSTPGLSEIAGTVEVRPYGGANALYRHGPVRVSDDRRHFEHADATPFFWLGDTWWIGLSRRLEWPHGFKTLAADRKQKGFTVIQIVGGLPPDMTPLDPRGAGDGGQSWTDDFESLRPEFYNAADVRIQHLVEAGLVPCIVAAWKDYLPVLGPEKLKRHWRNLVARYAAYPVVWVVGGEINRTRAQANFLQGRAPAMPDDQAGYRAAWTDIARYLQQVDPFDRVVGAHNQGDYQVVDDPSVLDMYFLQTGHSALFSVSAQIEWFGELREAAHRAPLVLSEANYQGLFAEGSYWDQLQRHQFWTTMLDGGAGHTYGSNGIWQVNQPGKPFGPSPHGNAWGNTPWPQAMHQAASAQLGWGKAFLEESNWRELRPASDRVAFAPIELPPFSESGARWVWPPAGTKDRVLMGGSVKVPAEGTIRRAVLRIACAAPYEMSVNDQMVHRVADRLDVSAELGHTPDWEFPLLGEYLKPGRNILRLRFEAENFARADGIAVHVRVEMADGTVVDSVSDGSWRWTNPEVSWPGAVLEYDPDKGSPRVAVLEERTRFPNNAEFRNFATYGPRAAEVPGREWIVYVPAAFAADVQGLPANRALTLVAFNPRTGESHDEVSVRADASGVWRWQPPQEHGDWVLGLTTEKGTR